LNGVSDSAGTDQLGLLRPHSAAADEHPRRANVRVISMTAHDGGFAIGGQRDGKALLRSSDIVAANQLDLLAPSSAAARKDPCRAKAGVVVRPSHDGSIAVGGQ
jgi:hypothetical protein